MVAASLVTKNRSHGLALGLKHIYKASLGEIKGSFLSRSSDRILMMLSFISGC
jgi:hypothetical protein